MLNETIVYRNIETDAGNEYVYLQEFHLEVFPN